MTHSPNNSETLKDFNRLAINYRKSLIQEVLPEYFQEDFPDLITFLEGYYEYLDSDGQWGGVINELQTIRDMEDTELSRLDFLFHELGLGISNGQFTYPREALRNMGNFFRVKGSDYSGMGFFRGFFNEEEVEITQPKDRLFRTNTSELGPEMGYVLQDGAIFQIFSLLIKSPLPIKQWRDLWRRYVHPSGFHLAAEIVITSTDTMPFTTAQSIGDKGPLNVFSSVVFNYNRIEGEVTGLYEDNNDDEGQYFAQRRYVQSGYYTPEEDDADLARERLSVYKTPLAFDSSLNITIGHIIDNYGTIDQWAGFHLDLADTYTRFSDSSYTTFDEVYHVQYVDSDGPVSLYNYYK